MFTLHSLWWEFLSWMDVEHALLDLVDMVYLIDWFAYVEPSLWTWGESRLVMVYDLFYVLLDSVCQYFVENFCICIYQRCWPVIFFFGSVGFGIWVMFACLWEYSLLFNLWSSLRRISKSSSLCVSRFSWWNHLVVGFCLYRAFWWQILFHFQWSLCSSYCFFEIPFWGLCVPGKLSFSRLLDCLAHKSSHCSLTDFLYFCDICWYFSFFISYFLWICSLFLVSLVKGWSILCTLSENQFLVYCIFFTSTLNCCVCVCRRFHFALFTLCTMIHRYYFPKKLSDTLKIIIKNKNKSLILPFKNNL